MTETERRTALMHFSQLSSQIVDKGKHLGFFQILLQFSLNEFIFSVGDLILNLESSALFHFIVLVSFLIGRYFRWAGFLFKFFLITLHFVNYLEHYSTHEQFKILMC